MQVWVSQGIGSCADRLLIDIQVDDVVEAPTGDEIQYFCDQSNVTLSDLVVSNTAGFTNIYWYDVDDNSGTHLPLDTVLQDNTTYYAFQGFGTCAESLAVTVVLNCEPTITLTKSGPMTFCPSDESVTYTIIVTNTGNIPLTGVVVSDANADEINPSVINLLNPGESVTVVAVHYVTNDDVINGSILNSATVEATAINGDIVTDISDDPNNSDDVDSDGDGDPDDVTVVLLDTDCDGEPNADDIDDDNDGIIDIVENIGGDPDLDEDGDNVPQYLDDDDTDPSVGNDDGLPENDTDGDNLPDHLDIDADGDGIPDNVEGQGTLDYAEPLGIDTDGDSLDDQYDDVDSIGIIPVDTDGDLIPDYLDSDSDNDNVPDNIEGNDQNHDGIADSSSTGVDSDHDGLDDGFEGSDLLDIDVNDEIDIPFIDLPDTDIDVNDPDNGGDVDYRDVDDDNDGIPTIEEDTDEDGNYANDDCDADGIPDYLDPDICELIIPEGFSPDGDGQNDDFYIEGLANLYPDFTLEIYDRYGNIVYHYQHDGSPSEPEWWNGISNGRLTISKSTGVPVGTYFYILKPNRKGVRARVGWLYVNK
jgi:gliding motility-associated-like protein